MYLLCMLIIPDAYIASVIGNVGDYSMQPEISGAQARMPARSVQAEINL
jgi:hypothetical protein